jgi:glycosyltransferase involved in cell wall biosynthesis
VIRLLKISIIIPVYNAAKYLSLCLDSIVSQTYKDLEVIVVDDKSTDKSINLLNKYKRMYKNIKIIALKHNKGVSHARNVGIDAAKGDYLFFIDSDDFMEKDAISKMADISLKYNADVVDTERLLWYKKKSRLLTFTEQKKLKNDLVLGDIHNDTRIVTMPRYVTGKLYKRSVIADIRFNENIRCYEDVLFNHQIKANCTNYVYAKGVFYHYLQRPTSLINTISINHMDYVYASKEIKKIYVDNNYFNAPIKDIVDNILVGDILVILSLKIPKMDLSTNDKKAKAQELTDLVKDLSLSHLKVIDKIGLSLFKSKVFLSVYFMLVRKLNLVGLGFSVLAILHPYRIKNLQLKSKVMEIYDKMN